MPTRFFVFLATADRLCDALISTRPHDSNPDWGNSRLGVDVCRDSCGNALLAICGGLASASRRAEAADRMTSVRSQG